MKILFSIYSAKGKPGGHFFSFEHIINALSTHLDVVIMSIGCKHPVVESLPFKKYNVCSDFKGMSKIREIIKKEQPDCLHCFDSVSYSYINISTIFMKRNIVLTIPGGNPNPYNIPYCKNIILFSGETMKSFGDCPKFSKTKFHYIPNRVDRQLLTNCLKSDKNIFTFVQIIRINTGKHLQIQKTLQFLKRIVDEKIHARLILAGTVNSPSEKKYIEEYVRENHLNEHFTLITDGRVNRGSDLLSLGDCIIGTGRSVMEAAILGKSVLVPVQNIEYPVLLDRENFEGLIMYNFSGRTTDSFTEDEFDKIKRVINDPLYSLQNKEFLKKISDEYFELNLNIINRFIEIYRDAKNMDSTALMQNISLYLKFILKLMLGKDLR